MLGLKILSSSKLFGEGPLCLHTSSSTLVKIKIGRKSAQTLFLTNWVFINVESSDGSDTFSMMCGIRSRREASKANPVLVKIKGRSEMNLCVLCRILRQPKLAKMKCSGPEPRVLISLLCWHAYAAVPFQLV